MLFKHITSLLAVALAWLFEPLFTALTRLMGRTGLIAYAQFSAGNANFTPVAHATNANNFTLTVLTVGMLARVKMFNWGGSGTTSTGYVTRWGRVTNTPATPTALTVTPTNPNTTALASCNTYGTTPAMAAQPAGLFQQNWNVLGGGGVVVLPIGGEWQIVGGALGTLFNQICCGNTTGSDASLSNYGVTWEE